ncbi:reverse transcriptase domain-containing protein [Tanacetum coccineum]
MANPDDEPMWAADCLVAPTPGPAITIPATANEFSIKGNHLTLVKGNQFNGHNRTDPHKHIHEFLGNGRHALKMDARYKEIKSCSECNNCEGNHSIADCNNDDTPMSREEEAKFMQPFRRTRFYNDYRDRDSNRDNLHSSERSYYNRDYYRPNTDDKPDLQKQLSGFIKAQQSTNLFFKEIFLDLNTKLEATTKNHQASIHNLEAKYDRLANKQSARPLGSLLSNTQPNPKGSSSKPYQPPQTQNEYVNAISTRSGMPNYGKFLKELVSNRHNLEQISSTFLSDESFTIIQNKVPPKLGDSGSFLITFEVGKFTFPMDFVILKIEEDRKVSLILGRPFLLTADVVIRVKQKQLYLRVGSKRMVFSIDSAMKHSYSNDDTCFNIDVIDEILEEDFNTLLDEGSKILYSIEGTPLEDKLFAEFDEFITMNIKENTKPKINEEEITFEKIKFDTG